MTGDAARGAERGARAYPGAVVQAGVVVAPLSRLLDETVPRGFHVGGPCWPDPEGAAAVRYLNHAGVPLDRWEAPDAAAAEIETVPGLWWWIGPLSRHFGHFAAEFAVRLRPVLDHDPQARVVLARSFGGRQKADGPTPGFAEEILRWHGVPPERVRIVDRPMRFERLGSVPQPERLYPGPDSAPEAAYLASLSRNLAARLGPRPRGGRGPRWIYVSRSRVALGLAGEAVLDAAMAAAGVTVVHPQALPVVEQLRLYREAELAVFAEGSALHGLQLGGRDFGKTVVLNRRPPSARMAEHLLAPRCAELVYLDLGGRFLAGRKRNGAARQSAGLRVPSPDALTEALLPHGIDLRGRIDAEAFRAAAGRDLRRFAAQVGPEVFGLGARTARELAGAVLATGLPGRRRAAARIVARWARFAAARRLRRKRLS